MRVEVVVIQAHGGNKTCWNYVVEHLTADDAVLVIDETGFLKQGRTSCGALLGVNANHWFGAWNTTPLIAGEAKDIAQELPAEAWQRLDASSDSSPSMVDSFGPQSPRQSLEDLGRWERFQVPAETSEALAEDTPGAIACQSRLDRVKQCLLVQRLGQELDGPGFHRLNRHGNVAMTADKYDWKVNAQFHQGTLEFKSAHPWHFDIKHNAAR